MNNGSCREGKVLRNFFPQVLPAIDCLCHLLYPEKGEVPFPSEDNMRNAEVKWFILGEEFLSPNLRATVSTVIETIDFHHNDGRHKRLRCFVNIDWGGGERRAVLVVQYC
ncbi:hypothetical protein CEXT_289001 [Caerostris extrusa]|uniref:Uncharacterized protein n=1 Tax=Caerostris extrusa TaxID=172846 RepID=A0AAV4XX17_CAEEX|nr:hypothetical protein CEXT_289001 [Caerostris extrusa]